MSVLVSGASGFVGAHVVEALAAAGLGPIMAADLAPPPDMRSEPASVRRIMLDVTDREAVRFACETWRPNFIVHAAAITPSLEDEAREMGRIAAVNVGGTANMAEAALATGAQRLVVFSSSAVYNGQAIYPEVLREDAPLPERPASLYAATKLACEGIAYRAAAAGLSACAIRVASVYGERERATDSRKAARLSQMHRLARAAATGEPVRIEGATARRDWVHGADVGAAVAKLLTASTVSHGVYNVGSGRAAAFSEIVGFFISEGLRVTQDPTAPLVAMPDADDRPPLDITRLATDASFPPARQLAEGVRALVGFHREVGR